MKRLVMWAMLVLGLTLAPTICDAEDYATEQARRHDEKGKKFFNLGQWDDAIAEYRAAYELRSDPAFLFNLAQAYRRKGDLQRSLDLYKNFLIENPKSRKRADIENRIQNLEREMNNSPRQATTQAPVTTPVTLRPVDAAPTTGTPPTSGKNVPPASIVRAPPSNLDAAPFSSPISGPMPVVAKPVPTLAPVATTAARSDGMIEAQPTLQTLDNSGRNLRRAGLIGGGIGLVSIGTAIYFYFEASNLSDKVSNSDAPDMSDHNAGKRAVTMQWVFYSVATAALGTGTILYWLGSRPATVTPIAGPTMVGLTATGRF